MACGVINFTEILKLPKYHFILLHLTFACYYCSTDLERQSEHSRLCSDTSNFFDFLLKTSTVFRYIRNFQSKLLAKRTDFLEIQTRLLVSGRSLECSDCLLKFCGAVITFEN